MLDEKSLMEVHTRLNKLRNHRVRRLARQLHHMLCAEYSNGSSERKLSVFAFALAEREFDAGIRGLVRKSGTSDRHLPVSLRLLAMAVSLTSACSKSLEVVEYCDASDTERIFILGRDPVATTGLAKYVNDLGAGVARRAAFRHIRAIAPVADQLMDRTVRMMVGASAEPGDESLATLSRRRDELGSTALQFGRNAEPKMWGPSTHNPNVAWRVIAASKVADNISDLAAQDLETGFEFGNFAPAPLCRAIFFRMKKEGLACVEHTVLGITVPLLEKLNAELLELAPQIWALAQTPQQEPRFDKRTYDWSPRWRLARLSRDEEQFFA